MNLKEWYKQNRWIIDSFLFIIVNIVLAIIIAVNHWSVNWFVVLIPIELFGLFIVGMLISFGIYIISTIIEGKKEEKRKKEEKND